MKKLLITLCFIVLLIGCSSETNDSISFNSPNKIHSIKIEKVLQDSNDPASYWVHISFLKFNDSNQSTEKLLIMKGNGEVKAKWITDSNVLVVIDDTLWKNYSIATQFIKDNVTIQFASESSMK